MHYEIFFFSTGMNSFVFDSWLLIQRIVLSIFMLTHGWPKMIKLFAEGPISFPDPLGIGMRYSLILAMLAEVLAPLLIIAGLASRLSSVFVIVTMFVAAFVVHASDPFARKEMALLYLVGFIGVLILGPGRFSLDRALR
jgi:putative oxidoreductase